MFMLLLFKFVNFTFIRESKHVEFHYSFCINSHR